ncbi:MAG: DUF2851 family protein [Prevotella sp.]|nr:DUF2851 family protein [Prevotella sp.]
MEQLLHYVWKHKMFPLSALHTTDGQPVEVVDAGLHNRHQGPDFFNAKVKIGETLWVGNIEIHERSSDWYQHHHETDEAYGNVILHVVGTVDRDDIVTSDGKRLPQMVLKVPQSVAENYQSLLTSDSYPPCHRVVSGLGKLTVHSWMSALSAERLSQKSDAIMERRRQLNCSWEAAYFTTLARNFGFGVNGEAFETWARHISLTTIAHHRDNEFQIEAIFFGQAGLLDDAALPGRYQPQALDDAYYQRLRKEYLYLAHKFTLTPMDHRLWRFLRLRPQNFPHIRLAQLVGLYCHHRSELSLLLECQTVDEAKQLLSTSVTDYWKTHYLFGVESPSSDKHLSEASLNLLLVNTVVPVLFAFGRYQHSEKYCDRAFMFLEQLKAEQNFITRMWRDCGLKVDTAADSQALIQLKTRYCDRKDCLRCRIGYEFLRQRQQPLSTLDNPDIQQ